MANDAPLPDYPFFEVDDATTVFGCKAGQYLSRGDGSRVARQLRRERDIFSALFFSGGRLEDHGIRFKPEYCGKGFRTIVALMKSFQPSHEAKEGTVALALHHWCEPIDVLITQPERSE